MPCAGRRPWSPAHAGDRCRHRPVDVHGQRRRRRRGCGRPRAGSPARRGVVAVSVRRPGLDGGGVRSRRAGPGRQHRPGPAGGRGDAAVVSRIDTLEVEEVLAGDASLDSAASTLLVEEEGWLGDGTAIAVNGLAPSEAGMDAIWFLDRDRTPRFLATWSSTTRAGSWWTATGSRAPTGSDPLVAALEPLGPDGLTSAAPGGRPQRLSRRPMAAFVLVHGAWSGAHGFHLVRRRLWAAGHEAFTPSLTGVGERVHLTGPGSRSRRTSPTSSTASCTRTSTPSCWSGSRTAARW